MKVRFQADADLRRPIIAGLRRGEPAIDFRTAHEAGLAGLNDATVLAIAADEGRPSERTEWILPKSLKRGEIYLWSVIAVVDGKEIVSPGPSSPEMKFQVLSLSSLQQLNQLQKTPISRSVFSM